MNNCESRSRFEMEKNHDGVKLEICCDCVASVLEAVKGGADRIELCAGLVDGGITPSTGMMKQVRKNCSIPVFVLVRPRGQDFVYDAVEVEIMCDDIVAVKEAGLDGVVIGALDVYGDIDTEIMETLIRTARANDLSVTFHRAIDMSRSPLITLEKCIDLGVDYVLTSGGANSVVEGEDAIKLLVTKAEGTCVTIIAGAGVSEANVGHLVSATGVSYVHGSFRIATQCRMEFKKHGVFMGAAKANTAESEFTCKVVSSGKVAMVKKIISSVGK
eukprot:m.25378 g.25378  ORF g.25378 m.25378 type:complete len:273 (+) comp14975_c0_seq1:44-862(+)